MAKYTYFWAVGSWDNRASLTYKPTSSANAKGERVDNYGRLSGAADFEAAYGVPLAHIEENDNVIYMEYAGTGTILKIEKA